MVVIIKKQKKKKIKIISFNIKSCQECHINHLIDYFVDKKPDVICLQEVDVCSKYCQEDICRILGEKLNYEYKYLKTLNRRIKGEYGICILSKYPIKNYEEYYYNNYNEKRGLQKVKIFIPHFNKEIIIFNTHLDYKSSRDLQVKECLDIINKHINFDCILCGDLNLNPKEEIYNSISCNFQKIIYNNTYSSKRPKQILDYILLHQNSNFDYNYEVDNINLSDHKPLLCRIINKKK